MSSKASDSISEHEVEARALVTIGPHDAYWLGDEVPFEVPAASIVRLQPPAGETPERVAAVKAELEAQGCVVIVGPQAAQSESLPQASRGRVVLGTRREVVLGLCQEGVSRRKSELRAVLEDIMDEEKL